MNTSVDQQFLFTLNSIQHVVLQTLHRVVMDRYLDMRRIQVTLMNCDEGILNNLKHSVR